VEDVSELQLARSRLVAAAVEERRRLERVLHDGVQQDLVDITVRLQLVRGLVTTAPDDALAGLDEIQQELRGALDRVRALAGGIYPAILDARGLPDALRQAVRSSGTTATVDAAGLGRYPAGVEASVYFLWRAVLDRVGGDADARIRVRETGDTLQVTIEARAPIDPLRAGDLVEGAGGTLTVESGSGSSRIEAAFPVG
jgi:signal transduction histidine kinase